MRSIKFGFANLAVCFCLTGLVSAACAQLPPDDSSSPSILRNLNHAHPRLLITDKDVLRVQRLIQ